VVLVASAGREASDFNEPAAALVSGGYRTVASEAPEINGTDPPDREFDRYDLAADVQAAVASDARTNGSATAVAVGHAFGNRVVRAARTRYPDTFPAAAGGKRPVPEKADEALFNCFNPLRTAQQRLADIRFALFADSNAVPEHWQRGWHAKTAKLQGRATPATADELWWQGGAGPILVIQAAADRIAPKRDAADLPLEESRDRVDLVVIERAGQALLPKRPEEIAEALPRYLESASQPS
jgi:pimeloyl-ACP methyl ester carboxylesterase